jgi:hypothetical protein
MSLPASIKKGAAIKGKESREANRRCGREINGISAVKARNNTDASPRAIAIGTLRTNKIIKIPNKSKELIKIFLS